MQIDDFRKEKNDSCAPENCDNGLNSSCRTPKDGTLTDKEAIDASNDLGVTRN
jgi:hypothetical protein